MFQYQDLDRSTQKSKFKVSIILITRVAKHLIYLDLVKSVNYANVG